MKTYLQAWQQTQDTSLPLYSEMNPNSVSIYSRNDVRLFGEFIKTDITDTVIDIGSGTGYTPGYIINHEFAWFVGLDPLDAVQKPEHDRIQAWAELMPFRDNSFTVGLIGTSLDHILCLQSFWDELYRVISDRVYIWTWLSNGKYKNIPSEKLFDRDKINLDNMPYNDYISDDIVDKHHIRHLPVDYFETEYIGGFKVKQHSAGIVPSHHLVELGK